ncbi:hypothetical protein MVEN_00705600 [Mycena venus]|uniref:Carboxylesterase type B domain-containing protein n=1 Tax=Mycena venus TaxID=2733690 RepID=A0A8H6YIU9_9AGAR|nr:hypothetical protein MVEN_00705600 [Mycena venus]
MRRCQGAVNTANNITHFLGIRYAAPPLGERSSSSPTRLTSNLHVSQLLSGSMEEDMLPGGMSRYNGEDTIRQSNRGIVVVTIQYRLGLFAFLVGSAVKKNGALNAGLLDQDFALRWVNKHISNFGRDPAKVTIWGESAGAGSVLQQVITHDGRTEPQLFRAAIPPRVIRFLPSFLPSFPVV